MKKFIFLSAVLFLFLIFPKSIRAANVCSQFYLDPQTISVGGIFTARATGCFSTNVGYQVKLLDDSRELITLDMQDLTGDKSQYSATFPKSISDQLNQDNYEVQLIDNETGNPIQSTTLIVRSETVVTNIEAEGWINTARVLTVCIGGFASEDDFHATSMKASCTGATLGVLCPWPHAFYLAGINAYLKPEDGTYYGCFNSDGIIDPKITQLQLDFSQGPTHIYTLVVDTAHPTPDYICPGEESIKTAIGCAPIGNTNELIAFFIRRAMGIIGGVAMLLIILASFQILTSQGDKYKLQSGKDMFTAAAAGLMLAIFAVLALQIIGHDILKIF